MYKLFDDLPSITPDLLEAVYARVRTGNDEFEKSYNAINYEFYNLKDYEDLKSWIRNNVLSKIISDSKQVANLKIGVHLLKSKIAIHKDHNRDACINYVIDSGGEKVTTLFYQEDQQTVIKEIEIPVGKWHALQTDIFHGINGINPSRQRLAITIGVGKADVGF